MTQGMQFYLDRDFFRVCPVFSNLEFKYYKGGKENEN